MQTINTPPGSRGKKNDLELSLCWFSETDSFTVGEVVLLNGVQRKVLSVNTEQIQPAFETEKKRVISITVNRY